MVPNNSSDAAATTTAAPATNKTKTASESDVYDRQIRLWGAEAQKKMQNSKVLYIHVTGGSSEVLKNLCLAGIKAEICDPRPASHLDSSPCFFTHPNNSSDGAEQQQQKKLKFDSVAHAVRPLVEELNPLLGSCPIVEKQPSELTKEDLKGYIVVVASQINLNLAVRLSKLLAEGSVLYTIDCFGMCGASMIDFGTGEERFRYRPEQGKKLLDPTPLKDKVPLSEMVKVPLHKATNRFHKKGPPPIWVMYRALLEYQDSTGNWLGDEGVDTDRAKEKIQEFLKEQQASLTDEELDNLVTAGMAQVAPVCAVLGGMIGNEVIKIISGKGEPANNTLLLDGRTCKAWTFLVKAKE